jgi:hypothetical protein
MPEPAAIKFGIASIISKSVRKIDIVTANNIW